MKGLGQLIFKGDSKSGFPRMYYYYSLTAHQLEQNDTYLGLKVSGCAISQPGISYGKQKPLYFKLKE